MIRLGVVTGLAAEARCLQRAADEEMSVVCSGGDAERGADGARSLIAEGADALLSFGLAGGLDPGLAPGAVIVGDAVIDMDGARFDTHAAWRVGLLAALAGLGPTAGVVVGSDRPIVTPAAKGALHTKLGAAVVDMESHALARVANQASVPFAVIRAVADAAGRALPRAALAGLGEDGNIRVGPVLGEIVRRPWELPGLVMVTVDVRRALAALRRCAAAGAPLFGCGNLG